MSYCLLLNSATNLIYFKELKLFTFSTRIQWYTQRGNGGFGSHIPLEYDPPDLYENAIKCFKEGLLLHLLDCEGVAQNLFQHYAPGTPPHH